MDALSEVSPTGSETRKPPRCNCTMVIRHNGQQKQVKSRAWDCPSCGLDKQRTLAEMAALARPDRMITLTYGQPLALSVRDLKTLRALEPEHFHSRPADALDRASWLLDLEDTTPAEHTLCDPETHVYEYVSKRGHRSLRWRTLAQCEHCCRRKSKMLIEWRKRLRRRFGDQVEYLCAIEDQPRSGALHIHMAVKGLPVFAAGSDEASFIRSAWLSLGGGSQVDVGHMDDERRGRSMGWYIGKYLAKRHDQRLARGFRRWSRTGGFAPQLRMGPPRKEPVETYELVHLGWRSPDPAEPLDRWHNVRMWPPDQT